MGVTGKYDFKGIKKMGAAALSAALASTSWGSWMVTVPVIRSFTNMFLELLVNWIANQGLVVLNLGAIYVEGEWDQRGFDDAIDEALRQVEFAGNKLTPEQKKEIDDKVIEAARRFIIITKHN